MLLEEMNNNVNNSQYIVKLPQQGWQEDKILKETDVYCSYGKKSFVWILGVVKMN